MPLQHPYWQRTDLKNLPPPPTVPGQKKRKRGPCKDPKENRRMRYVYTADGDMIDGIRAQAMRKAFYKLRVSNGSGIL